MSVALVILVSLLALNLAMGLVVLFKNRHLATNRYFFYFVVSIIGWLTANYFSNQIWLGLTVLLLVNKAVFIFPALCAFFVLQFSLEFTELSRRVPRWAQLGSIALTVGAVAISATSLVVAGITKGQGNIYNISFGPLSDVYFLYLLVYIGLVPPIFIWSLGRGGGQDKRVRLQYVLAGIVVSFMLALVTNLFVPLVLHNFSLVDVGPYTTLILIASITYAVVKHRLFDIRLIVARSITYFLVLLTLYSIYIVAAFSFSQLLFSGATNGGTQTALYGMLSLVLAFTFEPLRRKFERLTARIFYRDRYNGREVLDAVSRILVSELQLDRLLARSLDTICREMHIQFGQLVIFNHDQVYRIEHFGPLPRRLMVVPELRRLGTGLVVSAELVGGERKELLDGHGVQVSLGLKTGEEFVGYLLLGDKLSGDSYSDSDLGLLAIIGKELAVGISNAKAYAEIQAFNLTLQNRVDHATSRLRVANRHLKELDKTKDEFLSMASHQLRTPLTTIKGYLSMMTEGDAGKLTKTQHEFVNYAFDASERMVNLISDLLNVSRLEAGRFLIQTKPIDLDDMVADEVRQLQQHARNKHLELIYVPPADKLPPVELDDNKTRQVIMNFIDNAIYYTKTGSVTVSLSKAGELVRLEVTDTGIGVPEAAKKKLFSKFFRAENAQGVRPDGTGLGLYLARRVIADQNGTIIFKSTEGHGSTFGFELPIKSTNAKARA